ncbi:hypothetical protein ACFXKY_07865 [Streptomyces canus]|uniref:hypothetical protein n=1 Tax=Streptomyces canus TaxID=58343 RepID=UPI0036BD89DC
MGWLFNRGGDHQLAKTKYADRESASDRAARTRRAGHRRNTTAAARQGQAWEDADRQRHTTTSWWRGQG